MSQCDRLVVMLRARGRDGVCSWDLAYRSYMPHASSRIPELNDRGWVIEGVTQRWAGEVNGIGEELPSHAHYFIRGEPKPKQLALAV